MGDWKRPRVYVSMTRSFDKGVIAADTYMTDFVLLNSYHKRHEMNCLKMWKIREISPCESLGKTCTSSILGLH